MREIRWAILVVLAISLPLAALAQTAGVLPIYTGSAAGLTLGGWGTGKVVAGTSTYLNQPAVFGTSWRPWPGAPGWRSFLIGFYGPWRFPGRRWAGRPSGGR